MSLIWRVTQNSLRVDQNELKSAGAATEQMRLENSLVHEGQAVAMFQIAFINILK